MTLGEKLRFFRTAEGYTQAEMARMLHVERSTYTYYEVGKTLPDLRTVLILSRFYGLSMEFLADDTCVPFAGEDFLLQEAEKKSKNHKTAYTGSGGISKDCSCVPEKGVLE